MQHDLTSARNPKRRHVTTATPNTAAESTSMTDATLLLRLLAMLTSVLTAQPSSVTAAQQSTVKMTPGLRTFTCRDSMATTFVYVTRQTGQLGTVRRARTLSRHVGCTYRSVHEHADLGGGGSLSAHTKHSGGDGGGAIVSPLWSPVVCNSIVLDIPCRRHRNLKKKNLT